MRAQASPLAADHESTMKPRSWLSNSIALAILAQPALAHSSLVFVGGGSLGTSYCDAVVNSTGAPAELTASGSAAVLDNDLTLRAERLPHNVFGYFLTSRTQGFVANPAGSFGNLCLGGSIGRYVGNLQIKHSGPSGAFALQVDRTQTPTPTGHVPVMAGETWNFQAWHRDICGGSATSNFTNGLSIAFH